MAETTELFATIRQRLKSQGMTYKDLAAAMDLSEPSIKRMFAEKKLTLDKLLQIARLLGLTLAELAQEAERCNQTSVLSESQEASLTADVRLLLVAVCTLNNWKLGDIVGAYNISEAECVRYLLHLDKLRLIELLPENRIRLRVARDFEWLPNGPIRRFFREQGQADFLNSSFTEEGEAIRFVHGLLTAGAAQQLQNELRRLQKRFADLHEESAAAGLNEKQSVSLLYASRQGWEPPVFAGLRRP